MPQLARDLATQSDEEDNVLLLAMLLDACHQESLRETRFPDGRPRAAEGPAASVASGKAGPFTRWRPKPSGGRSADEVEASPAAPEGQGGSADSGFDSGAGEGNSSHSGKRRRRSSRRRGGNATEGTAGQSADGQGQGSSREGGD